MSRYLLPVLLMPLLVSCTNGTSSISEIEEDPYSFVLIDESKSIGEKTIKLSDLVEDYKVITFEDSDSALFKNWKTNVSDNYILVVQGGRMPIMLFTKDGKFVNNIGKPGEGPGEYQNVYDAVIDESQGSIFVG